MLCWTLQILQEIQSFPEYNDKQEKIPQLMVLTSKQITDKADQAKVNTQPFLMFECTVCNKILNTQTMAAKVKKAKLGDISLLFDWSSLNSTWKNPPVFQHCNACQKSASKKERQEQKRELRREQDSQRAELEKRKSVSYFNAQDNRRIGMVWLSRKIWPTNKCTCEVDFLRFSHHQSRYREKLSLYDSLPHRSRSPWPRNAKRWITSTSATTADGDLSARWMCLATCRTAWEWGVSIRTGEVCHVHTYEFVVQLNGKSCLQREEHLEIITPQFSQIVTTVYQGTSPVSSVREVFWMLERWGVTCATVTIEIWKPSTLMYNPRQR